MLLSLERWIGKVAVVTGANSRIGAATSNRLVEEGIIVVGIDKNTENIEANSSKLAEKGKLYAFKADLRKEEEIINAFKWTKENVGPVSILVNNAGVNFQTSMLNCVTEYWKNILDVNLLALCISTREAIKIMREHNIDGQIVNINSISGKEVLPNLHMYPPSKFASRAATESFRLELNGINSKIKIGYICPGCVDTPLLRAFMKTEDGAIIINDVYLQPEDIADAIIYMLSTPPHVQIQEVTVTPVGEAF